MKLVWSSLSHGALITQNKISASSKVLEMKRVDSPENQIQYKLKNLCELVVDQQWSPVSCFSWWHNGLKSLVSLCITWTVCMWIYNLLLTVKLFRTSLAFLKACFWVNTISLFLPAVLLKAHTMFWSGCCADICGWKHIRSDSDNAMKHTCVNVWRE